MNRIFILTIPIFVLAVVPWSFSSSFPLGQVRIAFAQPNAIEQRLSTINNCVNNNCINVTLQNAELIPPLGHNNKIIECKSGY